MRSDDSLKFPPSPIPRKPYFGAGLVLSLPSRILRFFDLLHRLLQHLWHHTGVKMTGVNKMISPPVLDELDLNLIIQRDANLPSI